MLYRPSADKRLWDTWVYPCRKDGLFHLFHLQNDVGDTWSELGHAVSTNMLDWQCVGTIPLRSEPPAWDSGTVLTGMVFEWGGAYFMTYGALHGQQEQIGILRSTDLYEWAKLDANPVLVARGPLYECEPATTAMGYVAWRDAFVRRVGGEFEAYLCARASRGHHNTRGCVARARSADLVNWTYYPPIHPGVYGEMEVPEYFRLGDYSYLIFSSANAFGLRVDVPSRRSASGTFYLIHDPVSDEITVPPDNLLLGSGEGAFDCYVGRVVQVEDQLVMYHHNVSSRSAFGLPKLVAQNPDGTLRLKHWPRIDSLAKHPITRVFRLHPDEDVDLHEPWAFSDTAVSALSTFGNSFRVVEPVVGDFVLDLTIQDCRARRVGVVVRYDERLQTGIAFYLDLAGASGEIGVLQRGHLPHTAVFLPRDRHHLSSTKNRYALKIIGSDEFIEVYLDQDLLFSSTQPTGMRRGRCGLVVEDGSVVFSDLRVSGM